MEEQKRFRLGIGNQMLIAITLVLIVLAFSNQFIQDTQKKIIPDNGTNAKKTPSPTQKIPSPITQKILPTSSPRISQPQNQISDFVYPGSQQLGNEIYQSTDNPTAITDWYRGKIDQLNMSTTSFVQTSTNGNIENVLVAAHETLQIQIEIRKKVDQTHTEIKIVRKST